MASLIGMTTEQAAADKARFTVRSSGSVWRTLPAEMTGRYVPDNVPDERDAETWGYGDAADVAAELLPADLQATWSLNMWKDHGKGARQRMRTLPVDDNGNPMLDAVETVTIGATWGAHHADDTWHAPMVDPNVTTMLVGADTGRTVMTVPATCHVTRTHYPVTGTYTDGRPRRDGVTRVAGTVDTYRDRNGRTVSMTTGMTTDGVRTVTRHRVMDAVNGQGAGTRPTRTYTDAVAGRTARETIGSGKWAPRVKASHPATKGAVRVGHVVDHVTGTLPVTFDRVRHTDTDTVAHTFDYPAATGTVTWETIGRLRTVRTVRTDTVDPLKLVTDVATWRTPHVNVAHRATVRTLPRTVTVRTVAHRTVTVPATVAVTWETVTLTSKGKPRKPKGPRKGSTNRATAPRGRGHVVAAATRTVSSETAAAARAMLDADTIG